jgi:hypothetical protein
MPMTLSLRQSYTYMLVVMMSIRSSGTLRSRHWRRESNHLLAYCYLASNFNKNLLLLEYILQLMRHSSSGGQSGCKGRF